MSSGYLRSKQMTMLDDLLAEVQPKKSSLNSRLQARYACRIESDGTWTVFDIFSGDSVDFGCRRTTQMQMSDAEDVMKVLNVLHPAIDCGTIH